MLWLGLWPWNGTGGSNIDLQEYCRPSLSAWIGFANIASLPFVKHFSHGRGSLEMEPLISLWVDTAILNSTNGHFQHFRILIALINIQGAISRK
jgi:hypothetical protein